MSAGRIKKADKYKSERADILRQVFEILGIDENNNKFILNDIENDETKTEQLNALIPDIKKYFNTASWCCWFSGKKAKNALLSMIRYLLKAMDYSLVYKNERKVIEGKLVSKSAYLVFKNDGVDV